MGYGSEGDIAVVVVLPGESGNSISDLLKQMHVEDGESELLQTLNGLQETHVALQLPRFKMEFGVHDLKSELKSTFGMARVFNGTGEFLAMSSDTDVHLSSVLHKAVVEVNEKGTKAAAVTAGIMVTRSAIIFEERPIEMLVDRPFIFLIREASTGMLLFAGGVRDLELDGSGEAE